MSGSGKSVLVAMSGGVDSSVAAALLAERGYAVTGVFLCMGTAVGDGGERACCSPEDAADARRVANRLGIGLHVLDLGEDFREIIDYFVAEYTAGRTPNPCIYCNMRLKFGRLADLATALGIEHLATGHHARIVDHHGRPAVARAKAHRKDQSYALFGVRPEVLPRMLLPIGEIDAKDRVREIARQLDLDVHDKPDSQEICFVADDDYAQLLAERAPEALRGGRIINTAGEQLGAHDGYGRFTIGQRRGLRVAAGVPMYVVAIDPASGDVTLGTREEACGRALRVSETVWHHRPAASEFEATVQIRYNHRGCPARVRLAADGGFMAKFAEPVHAITPGQAAVVYEGDVVLGGGWIEAAE
jgi:tRNA-specific 2-thiouridylase